MKKLLLALCVLALAGCSFNMNINNEITEDGEVRMRNGLNLGVEECVSGWDANLNAKDGALTHKIKIGKLN